MALSFIEDKVDFITYAFNSLLSGLLSSGYRFVPLRCYYDTLSTDKRVLLRHDVDRKPHNALRIAQIENSYGIKGTYYFRIVSESFNLSIIEKIASLGHEIGYHYEDVNLVFSLLDPALKKKLSREDLIDLSYEKFLLNLEVFRKIADIKTICMHGSPRAKFDNKIIWDKYNYKELGLILEPYMDVDFNLVAYFTDTGRRWNGSNFSVRDKVKSKYNFNCKTTYDLINNISSLPFQVMFTFHPERWHDNLISWSAEYLKQNLKNIIKKFFFVNSPSRTE